MLVHLGVENRLAFILKTSKTVGVEVSTSVLILEVLLYRVNRGRTARSIKIGDVKDVFVAVQTSNTSFHYGSAIDYEEIIGRHGGRFRTTQKWCTGGILGELGDFFQEVD